MTIHRTRVWVRTGLEIKSTIDPKDHDTIEILEHPNILKVRAITRNNRFSSNIR